MPTTQVSERIFQAALMCFQEVGIRGSSMDDIALAAGVGRMTAFRRFESKYRPAQLVLLRVAQATAWIRETYIDALDLSG